MAIRNHALTSFLGLNTEVSDFLLKDNEATAISNVDVDYRGYLRNRAGIDKVNDDAIAENATVKDVLGLYGFYKDGVASYKKICAAGTKLLQFDGTDWQDLKTSLVTGGRWNFITHLNVCYGVDEKNTPQKITESGTDYSSANWTGLANNDPPDLAPFIIEHRDRVFIAGDPDNASTVVYSTMNATPDFSNTGITGIPILKGDGQKVTGLSKLGFNLIVTKKHQIHHISGCTSADFVMRMLVPGKGCFAYRSLVNTGNTIIMLHDSGILNFNGQTIQDMSLNFKSKIDAILSSYIQNACAVYKDKRYWLSYTSSGTSNDKTLVIDSVSGACTEYDYGVNAFYLDLANNLYGACNSGFVRQLDTETDDDGSDIDSYWQSKYLDFGAPNVTKRIKECIVYCSLATEDLSFRFDIDHKTGGTGRQDWTKTVAPTSTTVTEVRFSCSKELVGKRFRLKISHNGSETFKVYQVIFRYEPIARRGDIASVK